MTLDGHREKLLAAIEHYRRAWGSKEVGIRHKPVVTMIDELYEVIRVQMGELPANPAPEPERKPQEQSTMTSAYALTELKELLVLQTEKLETLRKNKLIASAVVMERKIEETKKALSQAEKAMKK